MKKIATTLTLCLMMLGLFASTAEAGPLDGDNGNGVQVFCFVNSQSPCSSEPR